MRKKIRKIRNYWKGFNPLKLLRGYKRIVLTEKEKKDIFLRDHFLETDSMARVVSDRTGIPFGIVSMILNDAEFDVFTQIGLIRDPE